MQHDTPLTKRVEVLRSGVRAGERKAGVAGLPREAAGAPGEARRAARRAARGVQGLRGLVPGAS